jgi:DNA polymerase-2
MPNLGVIYQATYRIQQGVPVVYLFGRLVDGRTFLVRDSRQVPHFYVRAEDAGAVINARVAPSDRRGFNGEVLCLVEVPVPSDAPGVRDSMHERDLPTYEADVRFAMRYLIDRDVKSGCEIRGPERPGSGCDVVFDNPEVVSAVAAIEPRVLSFDIETNPDTNRLLAIACYSDGPSGPLVDEVAVVDPGDRPMPAGALGVRSEREALDYFVDVIERTDADIITGWNVIDFDLSFLARVAQRVRHPLRLGREDGALRIRPAEGFFGSGSASIPGRVVLDGMDLVRGAFVKMDDYSLDAVATSVLGEGKTLGGDGRDKVAEILDTYANDLAAFTTYARTDARLALEIVDKLDLIKLAFARSALTGMMPDRVAASIASFDFLYLSELTKRKIAAPSVKRPGSARVAQGGGAVFEPVVGMHTNVWVCDFKSLYPSIIRTFNIDPLGFCEAGDADDAIVTQDGTRFSRGESILPDMLDRLFPQRAEAKARGDEVASQAIKILMNSFYGVLGTPACRFYNPALANAITSQGRYLLDWSRRWFEERGFAVLYGDTDSVFVASGMDDPDAATEAANSLMAEFNGGLDAYVRDRAGVESKLELEFEKLYTKLFLAKVRGGASGARKRYAGIRHGAEAVEFVGMEVVRRDWTQLAKDVQRELYSRLFADTGVSDYLAGVVTDLRAGRLDDALVYRKGLRKGVDEYTKNVPPHVQAVRRSKEPPPRVVSYVVTTNGPELVAELSAAPDREHYVEKQVMPVAVPVLDAMGLDFRQVIGDDRQQELF